MDGTQWECNSSDTLLNDFFSQDDLKQLAVDAGIISTVCHVCDGICWRCPSVSTQTRYPRLTPAQHGRHWN